MKTGRTLLELAQELTRQREAKKDYLVDTRNLILDATEDGGHILTMENPAKHVSTILGLNDIAHRQIGSTLNIPAKYYDKMRRENPELLAQNVNSWFAHDPQTRMVRTLDGTARAFLSDRYRRIDNFEIAETVLPIIGEIKDARIESCEVTDERMYIKVVNPRLQTEVTPGDIVQSGILITNSEVGMGSMANLIYSSAASTTLLLAYLALALGIPLKGGLGEAIALGLITDTGGFSHANTDADVFALSAHLSSQGVDFAGLREHIEHCIRKEKMRLWGHLVQKVQFLGQGRIALSTVSRDDLALDNATREDTEGFVEYLRKIKDVQVACLLREEGDNCVKFSLRSGVEWDVWKIADELGGGGHKNAAGGTLLQPLDQACAKMTAKLENMLSF